jgi:hypothetical protein
LRYTNLHQAAALSEKYHQSTDTTEQEREIEIMLDDERIRAIMFRGRKLIDVPFVGQFAPADTIIGIAVVAAAQDVRFMQIILRRTDGEETRFAVDERKKSLRGDFRNYPVTDADLQVLATIARSILPD